MDKITPKKVFIGLLALYFVVLAFNLGSYLWFHFGSLEPSAVFYEKTNFDKEKNLPSIFSSILHFAASILLGVTAFLKLKIRKNKFLWLFLSILFLFLGLDELLRIHEKIGSNFSKNIIDTSGIFHYAWVIPYGIALLLLAVFLLKPLLQLPKKTLIQFIGAGVVFVSGAAGIEMFTGWYIDTNNLAEQNVNLLPEIFTLYTIEESLEMLGVSIFFFAILQFQKQYMLPKTNIKNNFQN